MTQHLHSREHVVVVTGAGGSGCGRAIARRFAADRAAVVVADINDAGGRETVQLIERAGGRAVFVRADVRQEPDAQKLIAAAERTFAAVTILVNNASAPFQPAEPLEHWADTVRTDLCGAMFCSRAAIDAMRRAGSGAIVNIASISSLWHGRRTAGGAPAYDAAKAGLIRLTTALADLAQTDRIRVNCLAPGWIDTDGPRQYWASLTVDERKTRGVPSRLLPTEGIANAVSRLATDESLNGRILVWWPDDEPRLIRWGDRGYAEDEPF